MCTRPGTLGLATVWSDKDLSVDDDTWVCQTIDQITEEARVFYWARKLLQFLVP